MPTYTLNITIEHRGYTVPIDSFGEGPIPIIICGHAETYAELLKKAFSDADLLKKYRFFVPRTYWCQDAPLASLPAEIVSRLTFTDLAKHIEEIRVGLVKQGVLHATDNKVGIYAHSFFCALAFHYAACFPQNVLFIEAEGPPPYSTDQWAKEKALYFKANASKERQDALAEEKIEPSGSAVDAKSMDSFASFRNAYHRMNATVWKDYKTDHRDKIWGSKKLNMVMMKHYFVNLLDNYDCRSIIDRVNCPVHFSLGIFDVPVPPYLWIDPPKVGGIGFFNTKKRDYFIHTASGHWPFTEQSRECCYQFDKFVNEIVIPLQPQRIREILFACQERQAGASPPRSKL